MRMFGRKKKNAEPAEELEVVEAPEAEATDEVPAAPSASHAKAVKTDRSRGPLDASEANDDLEGMIDLGSLRLPIVQGMNLNLEVEENSQQVVSVAVELEGSRVQLQAFAAPKSEGLWDGISSQIDQSVTAQGGRTDRREGRFGPELLARVPMAGPDGEAGTMIARFVGVDGPRWFLRAVFGGPAAINEEAAQVLEDLVGGVIVDRGQTPMAPTELLPLRMPQADPEPVIAADEPDAAPADPSSEERPERGPEITQIG
ncbi:DUF3710 domain-containing protein [Galactobacter valiniphilus]|uniref:DUF3710 domain-containing protein n=2 Tax=Galactobacter valiniphilus TaxID=2676122 RepID=A0A399JFP5_9MICC|nr:DUF3710 domain-containing protein [Galactobacter valiniphilus]